MKIEFEVPDGECCSDCPHQEGFSVDETEITRTGDPYPHYMRMIKANCHLFNEPICGISFEKMAKCESCIRKSRKN